MSLKLLPTADHVVLKRAPAEEVSRGGIIIPKAAQEKSVECLVVAVGPGKMLDNGKRVPMDIRMGDRVVISKWGGSEIRVDDEEHVFVRYDDILGVVER